MRNKIKLVTYSVVSIFILLLNYGNANAVDVGSSNCAANSSAHFNFDVEPAITIVAINPVLDNLCPGCGRSWSCGQGPYIQWDVTGSLECLYDFNGGRIRRCTGDANASLIGCWYQLNAQGIWEPRQDENPRNFFNNNGHGFGAFRYYLTSQTSNCNASGVYCFCVTATVNYVCGFVQIEEDPCPTCPL